MFSSVEKLIALRNLRPKKKEGFLKVISTFSFIGIMLGVAILIIVMSVMNGFRTDLTNKILGFNPHIIIKPYNNVKIDSEYKKKLKDNFKGIEFLDSYSGEGVVMNSETTKGVIIKGLDQNNKKNLAFLKKCKKNNKIVYGMGAPVKGNTLLNYFKIDTKLIPILLEKNNLRDGLYSPGTHIPIKMEDNVKKLPDIYYVLAWNFKTEILKKNKNLIKKGIKFYFPIKVND